jgi:hypothetical protein
LFLRIKAHIIISNILTFIFLFGGNSHAQNYTPGNIHLTQSANGVSGLLTIKIDPRIPQTLRSEMWGNGDWSYEVEENDPLYTAFLKRPPAHAILEAVDSVGQIIDRKELDVSLAKVEPVSLHGAESYILLTEDYSVGFGSYAGLTSEIVTVKGGRIHWVDAIDSIGNRKRIRMSRTVKFGWKTVPSSTANVTDILAVYCKPTDDLKDLNIEYVRYHFAGRIWHVSSRMVKGEWESDEDFPDLSLFP